MRPEIKAFKEFGKTQKALSASEIENRTGMNYNTVVNVLDSLQEVGAIQKIETSGYSYYKASSD